MVGGHGRRGRCLGAPAASAAEVRAAPGDRPGLERRARRVVTGRVVCLDPDGVRRSAVERADPHVVVLGRADGVPVEEVRVAGDGDVVCRIRPADGEVIESVREKREVPGADGGVVSETRRCPRVASRRWWPLWSIPRYELSAGLGEPPPAVTARSGPPVAAACDRSLPGRTDRPGRRELHDRDHRTSMSTCIERRAST